MFALPTNIGSHHRDKFTVIPEVGINVGYRLTPWASVVLGYTFLYASSVARPGNQIDTTLNSSQSAALTLNSQTALTGPARPAVKIEGSDFWAHGLNVGLAFNF
jgi:hypothetical protein